MEWALFSKEGIEFLLRWGHFLGGVSWIGILWFFNFSQGPFMNEVDAPVKTAVNAKLSPRTLWYFRWGAMLTFLTGWAIIGLRMSVPGGAELLRTSWGVTILTGALLGSLMWFNVWFVIWPRQKKIIAAAQGGPAVENAPAVARRAFLASRTNTLLSIPLLFLMGAASHLPLPVNPGGLTAWWVILVAVLVLLEINALKATNGPTTKPIEKVGGVIHMGVWLTVVLYVLLEVLL
ncbi:MAG TPA: urate hydroxylase PuuD [Sphingomonadales bacterium]